MPFLVLSSSRGTTFQAVLDAIARGTLTAPCLGLISDRADRGCVAKAQAAKLPVAIVEPKAGESNEQYDRRLQKESEAFAPQSSKLKAQSSVIAAMGWMHILTPWFIKQWKNRILNIHPALLPKYGGVGMFGDRVHQAVLSNREKESGITIHLMDEGIDTGPILLQKTCPVLAGDTVESLRARVQALEREWYPKVLEMIEQGELALTSQNEGE